MHLERLRGEGIELRIVWRYSGNYGMIVRYRSWRVIGVVGAVGVAEVLLRHCGCFGYLLGSLGLFMVT